MTPYPRLFAPLAVGPMALRNRIVVPPHGVSFLPGHGTPVDRVIAYHVERARGGAAMVTMSNFVMPPSWRRLGSWGGALPLTPLGGLDVANDPDLLPAYRRLIDGVHGEGAVFVAQLNATGRQYFSAGMASYGLPLVAPSPLPCPRTRQIPRAMTEADIAELVDTFGDAAAAMREAGADGVELFAAQGYLLSEFLSPHTNRRDDAYGGDAERRLRIVVDSLAAIRRRAGDGFAVGLRLNGEDGAPGGLTLAMACDVARRLAATGLVDYLNVSGLTYLDYPAWIADMTAPEATFAAQAAAIRAAVPGLPVCVATRIGSPETAERVLAAGQADLVGMARALIADPELPLKAREGRGEDIRRCTYSNQSCSMGQTLGRGVGCLQNVAVGREAALGIGRMRPAARAKRVLVIGGGPAGLAAARVAAERGHAVTLCERGAALGGQNLMTARIASRRGFAEVTRWQARAAAQAGVDIRLRTEATPALVAGLGAEAVVLAAGSRPRRDGYSSFRPDVDRMPGAEQDNVATVWDVFERPAAVGRRVVLVDEDPHLSGLFTAEHLADLGHAVEIVTPHHHPGRELHLNFVSDVYRRIKPKGVVVTTDTLVVAVDGATVLCRDRHDGRERPIAGVDTVVLAMGNVVEDALRPALEAAVPELHVVGDCLAPRKLDEAIADGERAGWML